MSRTPRDDSESDDGTLAAIAAQWGGGAVTHDAGMFGGAADWGSGSGPDSDADWSSDSDSDLDADVMAQATEVLGHAPTVGGMVAVRRREQRPPTPSRLDAPPLQATVSRAQALTAALLARNKALVAEYRKAKRLLSQFRDLKGREIEQLEQEVEKARAANGGCESGVKQEKKAAQKARTAQAKANRQVEELKEELAQARADARWKYAELESQLAACQEQMRTMAAKHAQEAKKAENELRQAGLECTARVQRFQREAATKGDAAVAVQESLAACKAKTEKAKANFENLQGLLGRVREAVRAMPTVGCRHALALRRSYDGVLGVMQDMAAWAETGADGEEVGDMLRRMAKIMGEDAVMTARERAQMLCKNGGEAEVEKEDWNNLMLQAEILLGKAAEDVQVENAEPSAYVGPPILRCGGAHVDAA